ncbi:MauE/DoxX family redox-associated membrane protein [Nocardioides cavernaquae]|uniref:DoxX family membrane protein n=1 Tax=Nocardioides cavernaquae TaxID=2321396 RepID=A0A3A5H2V4_9ACTN|nr:MauE/DoxX family redox-associated membrane protein [Nocardioides cavernaquae]RJS45126.1 DoxX family membrane protein [Nocardioides cavernaquae]
MRAWLGLLARWVLGGVWLYAGGVKLADPWASVAAVRAYELLPGSTPVFVGHALPILEVALGACLVLGLLTRASAALSAGLLLVFVAGIVSVWVRGIEIDCGCFGGGGSVPDGSSAYPLEIARDLGLTALALFVLALRRTPLTLDRVLLPRTTEPEETPHA